MREWESEVSWDRENEGKAKPHQNEYVNIFTYV